MYIYIYRYILDKQYKVISHYIPYKLNIYIYITPNIQYVCMIMYVYIYTDV